MTPTDRQALAARLRALQVDLEQENERCATEMKGLNAHEEPCGLCDLGRNRIALLREAAIALSSAPALPAGTYPRTDVEHLRVAVRRLIANRLVPIIDAIGACNHRQCDHPRDFLPVYQLGMFADELRRTCWDDATSADNPEGNRT